MRGRALVASRSALTRPAQIWSGISLRATRFDDDAGGDDGDDDDMMMTMMIMRMKLLLATNGSWPTKTSHTSQSVMDYCKQLDHDHDHDLGE